MLLPPPPPIVGDSKVVILQVPPVPVLKTVSTCNNKTNYANASVTFSLLCVCDVIVFFSDVTV